MNMKKLLELAVVIIVLFVAIKLVVWSVLTLLPIVLALVILGVIYYFCKKKGIFKDEKNKSEEDI